MSTRPLAVVAGVFGVMLGLHPGPVLAQVDESGAPLLAEADLDRVVADLDSDEPAARESASQVLANDPRVSLRRLERFLTGSALSREQRRRLLSAAFERFGSEPRAAMGVSFEQMPRESGVRLATVVPNFPSAGLLRPGDRVLMFDGVPLRDQQQAVAMIVAHDPGDEIQVALQRQGEAMTVAVPLGRRDRLDNPVPASGQMLIDAWATRSRPYTGDAEAVVIEGGLAPGEWAAGGVPGADSGVAVVAGGEPRGGIDPILAGREGQGRATVDAVIIRQQPRIDRWDARDPQHPVVLQRRVVRDEVTRLRTEINQMRDLQRRADMSAEQRRALEMRIQRYLELVRAHEQQLQVLDAQLGRPPR